MYVLLRVVDNTRKVLYKCSPSQLSFDDFLQYYTLPCSILYNMHTEGYQLASDRKLFKGFRLHLFTSSMAVKRPYCIILRPSAHLKQTGK